MSENKDTLNGSQKKQFTDLLIVLIKWRKLIFWNTLIVTLIAIIIGFSLDKWYTSTASFLPPKKKGGLFGDIGGLSSSLKDISKTLGRLGSTSDEAYNYLAILQSRTSLDKVIKKFNLRQVYEIKKDKPVENVFDELNSHVDFNVADEGNITVKVTDKDPLRAANMANYFVDVLNDISVDLATLEAKNNREFIEKRYNQLEVDLKNTEDSMRVFGEKHNIYEIEEQTKVELSTAAKLKSEIEIQEIEYKILANSLGNDHPLVAEYSEKIKQLNNRLREMKFGGELNGQSDELFTPFMKIPSIGVEYIRLKRNYEIQTRLLEFILPIYEQAKIEEKKDIPVVMVLDKAVPAQKKSSPKVSIIAIIAFVVSLFLSIIFALIVDKLHEIKKQKEKYQKLDKGIFIPLRHFFSYKE